MGGSKGNSWMCKKSISTLLFAFFNGYSLVAAIPPSLSMSAPPTKKHCRHTHTPAAVNPSVDENLTHTLEWHAISAVFGRSEGGGSCFCGHECAAAQTERSPPPDRRTSMLIAKVAEGGQTLSIPRDSFGCAVKGGLTYCDFRVTPCQSH